jgi:anaerobic magnesium-protoporphyrin IX monomethyl ester cyclase
MKVLLIQPPIEDFYDTKIRTYPLGLLHIAARIRDICDVSVADLRTGVKPKPLQDHPFPELKPYYKEHAKSPFSLFSRYYRFGQSHEEIRKTIAGLQPDMVCISSLFTTYAPEAIDVARAAKEVNSAIVTVMGGIHPTLFPRPVLKSPFVDYVVRGDGGTPLFELIKLLKSGMPQGAGLIPGICAKDVTGLHVSHMRIEEDIDLIPDRSFVDSAAYRIGRRNYTFLLTSRGCPFHCAFCGKPPVPYRKRALAAIEKEVSELSALDIKAVDFEDDMVNLDKEFFREVLGLFRGKEFTLSAMNGIYTESLDEETLAAMYDAGFRRLNFSLVDVSAPVLRRQSRLFPLNFLKLLPYLESSPFLCEVHFVIGLPEQKPEEIIDTIIFLMGKRVLPGPSVFYLAPNSPVFSTIQECSPHGSSKWMRSSCMIPVNPHIPRDALYTFQQLTRFVNVVKSLLDTGVDIKKLSELGDTGLGGNRKYDDQILAALLREKRFTYFDAVKKDFFDEPQDRGLLKLFFKKAKGSVIKGFKTGNSVIVD